MLHRATTLFRSVVQQTLPWVSFQISQFRHGHDEIELELLPLLVQRDREAIDVGANIGRYTVPLSKLARHVQAFEPHPTLAHILASARMGNVTVRQAAVSDASGVVELHIPLVMGREDEGLAHISAREAPSNCRTIRVEAYKLDDFAFRDIGFVKIDVEGHELEVLQGARQLIRVQRPNLLVETDERHHAGAVGEIQSFFAERDYRGLFVRGTRLLPIEEFDSSMQDVGLLEDLGRYIPRRAIPYVNNFLFVPAENCSEDFIEAAERLLLREHVPQESSAGKEDAA
jgi:FkbM family methyltransferase